MAEVEVEAKTQKDTAAEHIGEAPVKLEQTREGTAGRCAGEVKSHRVSEALADWKSLLCTIYNLPAEKQPRHESMLLAIKCLCCCSCSCHDACAIHCICREPFIMHHAPVAVTGASHL